MSRLDVYKANLRARKAAALGMSLEQFNAHIEAEQSRIDEYNLCVYDHDHQMATIARWAKGHRRTFTKFDLEEPVHGNS